MKSKNKKTIVIENNKPFVVINGKKHDDAFADSIKVTIIGKIINYNSFINCVYVSKEVYDFFGSVAVLYNTKTKAYQEVFCHVKATLKGKEIKASLTLINNFKCKENDELLLLKYKHASFNKVKTQMIDNIKEDYVALSEKTLNSIFPNINASKYRLFSLYNSITGEHLIIKRKHIKVENSLEEGTVRLSRILRIFLGLQARDYVPNLAWDLLDTKSEEYKKITQIYDESTHEIKNGVNYLDKDECNKTLNTTLGVKLELYPVIESINKQSRRNPWRVITDFYVGKSTLSLPCKRPYDIDEGKDVIRMSKNNMALLGISNMDQVRVTYRNKTIKCRVLELEDKDSFRATNLPTSVDLMVGIPINLRKKLGISNIESIVKIDRDTPFLFVKSLSEQVLPLLITLTASLIVSKADAMWTAIISIIAAPIVVFLNLSGKRKSRLK